MRACAFECSSYFFTLSHGFKGTTRVFTNRSARIQYFGYRSNNGGTGCVKSSGGDDGAGPREAAGASREYNLN